MHININLIRKVGIMIIAHFVELNFLHLKVTLILVTRQLILTIGFAINVLTILRILSSG